MTTKNEQALLDAAGRIESAVDTYRGAFDALKEKVDTLVEQAKSPTATEEPEDLSEEFQILNQALDGLGTAASALRGAASTVGNTGGQLDPLTTDPNQVGSAGGGVTGTGTPDTGPSGDMPPSDSDNVLKTTESGEEGGEPGEETIARDEDKSRFR